VDHLSEHSGVTRRGRFFISTILAAVIFTCVGFLISYGVGGYTNSTSAGKRPDNRVSEAGGLSVPITESGESPFVAVVERSSSAVVNITSTKRYRTRYNDMYDDFWRRFFRLPPREQVIPSYGSGFLITDDGYLVTNNHVVDGAEDITVTLADMTTLRARLVGTDPPTDLAVLKIDTDKNLNYVGFGSSADMKVGDWVVAIGNPFPTLGLDRTVTVGVVSGKGRSRLVLGEETPLYQDYIQTDASINPGNSGGPLLNIHGEVIGVNSAIASPSGGSVGIGFAVPSDLASQITGEIIGQGRVTRGYLGVVPRDVLPDEAEMVGLERVMGVYIAEVSSGSPAERAGLLPDDVVVEFNGSELTGEQDFKLKVASETEGNTVTLGIIRRGKRLNVDVVLGDRDAALASSGSGDVPAHDSDAVSNLWLGIRVADCTPELAYRYGVYFHEGAIVVDVEPGSPADVKGIVPGTIIVEINYVSISGKDDFDRVGEELTRRERAIAFHVFDTSGRIGYVAIKPR
jgi:serine protease Do